MLKSGKKLFIYFIFMIHIALRRIPLVFFAAVVFHFAHKYIIFGSNEFFFFSKKNSHAVHNKTTTVFLRIEHAKGKTMPTKYANIFIVLKSRPNRKNIIKICHGGGFNTTLTNATRRQQTLLAENTLLGMVTNRHTMWRMPKKI